MLRALRSTLAAAAALAALGGSASAQYYGGYWGWGGWGATPGGDIARGMGAYASGLGQLRVNTAQAASINTDTMMRWNQFLWQAQDNVNKYHYYHNIEKRAQNKQAQEAIAKRITENPNESDIDRGDALNAILHDLSDPRVHSSALRMARVPLSNKTIREIPFRYATEPITLSLHDLSGKDHWPLGLRREELAPERKAYEDAVQAALEEDRGGDLKPETADRVQEAVARLRSKAESTIPKDSPQYNDSMRYLKSLAGMAKMLESPKFDDVLAAVERYPGTTVADLLAFMQMYNLRFAEAKTPGEKKLYHELYPLLARQREQVLGQVAANTPPPAPGPAQGAAIFHDMPWEHLDGDGKPADEKK